MADEVVAGAGVVVGAGVGLGAGVVVGAVGAVVGVGVAAGAVLPVVVRDPTGTEAVPPEKVAPELPLTVGV